MRFSIWFLTLLFLAMPLEASLAAEKAKAASKYKVVACNELVLEPESYRGKRVEVFMQFSLRWQDGNVQFHCGNGYLDVLPGKLPKETRRWLLSLKPGRDDPYLTVRGRFIENDSLDFVLSADSIER